jgi:hypothetical protein
MIIVVRPVHATVPEISTLTRVRPSLVVYLHHDLPDCLTRFNRDVGFKSSRKYEVLRVEQRLQFACFGKLRSFPQKCLHDELFLCP